jgi:hypothetical protein
MEEKDQDLGNLLQNRKRPFLVTLLALLVLSITIIYLVRLINSITLWNFLAALPGISPLYLALTGLILTLVGALLFFGLWTGNPRAPRATRVLTVAYLGYQWLEWIQSVRVGNEFENWPFAAGMTLFVIIFIFWTLSRSDVKTFFGDMYEQS